MRGTYTIRQTNEIGWSRVEVIHRASITATCQRCSLLVQKGGRWDSGKTGNSGRKRKKVADDEKGVDFSSTPLGVPLPTNIRIIHEHKLKKR